MIAKSAEVVRDMPEGYESLMGVVVTFCRELLAEQGRKMQYERTNRRRTREEDFIVSSLPGYQS